MGIKELFNNTLKSLTSKDDGFSFRKLASLVVLGLVIYLHIKYVNNENVTSFLAYDFGFIAVLLGLLNLDRFVQARFGGNTSSTEVPQSDKPTDLTSQPGENPGN